MPRRVGITGGMGSRSTPFKKVSGSAPSTFFKKTSAPNFAVKVYGVEKAVRNFNKTFSNIESSMNKTFIAVLKLLEYEIKRTIRVGAYSAYDTGWMHDHVKHLLEKEFVDYLQGSAGVYGVDYAVYVHEGTKFMMGRNFIMVAIAKRYKLIRAMFIKAIQNDINKGLINA